MQRREFCRWLGACALAATGACVGGCASLLDWSDAQHAGRSASRQMARGSTEPTGSVETTASTEPTAGGEATPRTPDVAVFRGSQPGANVEAAIAAIGGMERFVRRGDRVLVKPNILTARAPEYAATTNPEVVAEVVRLAYEAGASDVLVMDNSTAPARQAYTVSGIAEAVNQVDGRMKALVQRDFERVAIPDGRALESWPLAVEVFEADVVINVPIAKTHGLAGVTLSMKNLMGIMGGTRGLVHQSFSQKIVDVNTLVKPQLVVLDAWRQLIRNGPTGGSLDDVRSPKTVIVGTNQASVDAVGTTLFDASPTDFEWLRLAAEQGLGEIDLRRLDVLRAQS